MGSLSAPLAPGGGREGGPDPFRGPLPGPGRLASAARLGGAQTLPRGQEGPECVQSTRSQPLDSLSDPFTWVDSSGHATGGALQLDFGQIWADLGLPATRENLLLC